VRQVFLQSKSITEARQLWLGRFPKAGLPAETIPSVEAYGRVTSSPVFALQSSPHYAASAMDGLAVESSKTIGAAPGKPLTLLMGQDCFPVDTGDPLPPGTDAVIMIEHVSLEGDLASIEQAVAPWQHVRPVGEDIVATDVLLPRHRKISSVDLGALLAAGVHTVAVVQRPRIAIIPTGDELVQPGSELRPGDIVEFNSHIISSLLREWGCEPIVMPPARDDRALLTSALRDALSHDAVLIIAGSSTGRGDFTAECIAELGEVVVQGVAMRPGKPVILGEVLGKPVTGLPGYPVSAHLCMQQFIKPLTEQYLGFGQPAPQYVTGKLTRRLVSPFGVEEFVRVKVGSVDDTLVVTPLSRGAGVITSLTRADGQVIVPHNTEGFSEGEEVKVELERDLRDIAKALVVIGSHDPALDHLDDLLRQKAGFSLSSTHVGSMGGILALRKGECHLAGVHLLDEESGTYNVPFVKRYFPGKPMFLVNLAARWQGFMVRTDFDPDVSLKDLPGLRFVNRQKGSGTRLLLDYHLRREGVDASTIRGYEREETTHLAVACAIKAGEADVGLGVLAAAQAMGLKFIPLCLEQFDLLLPSARQTDPRVAQVLNTIKSDDFAKLLSELGGYDTSNSGKTVWGG
jgi:putative molybdopterin biosynthesis protein